MNIEAIKRQTARHEWPPCFFPPPDLYPRWTATCWAAFWDLSSCRHFTDYSVGQIPWTAIDAWLERKHLTGDVGDAIAYVVRRMDAVWLKHEHARMAAEFERIKREAANG